MRKIKQIAGSDNRIYALCEDGTLWELNHSGEWTQHPEIPKSKPITTDEFSLEDLVNGAY